MDRVLADRESEFLADGAFIGVFGIGGAHHFAVLGDGVFTFEDLDHDRAGDHEIDQFAEEGTFLVDRVEAFGLLAGHADAPGSNDAKTGVLELGDDLAGQVASRGVRLDDRESALDGHCVWSLLEWGSEKVAPFSVPQWQWQDGMADGYGQRWAAWRNATISTTSSTIR